MIDDFIPEALQEFAETKKKQQREALIVLDGIEKVGDQATSLLPSLLRVVKLAVACKNISSPEKVRLPTEPEWERASNGDLNRLTDSTDPVYPWGLEWKHDASNSEETGLNRTCTVGLFPDGESS